MCVNPDCLILYNTLVGYWAKNCGNRMIPLIVVSVLLENCHQYGWFHESLLTRL